MILSETYQGLGMNARVHNLNLGLLVGWSPAENE